MKTAEKVRQKIQLSDHFTYGRLMRFCFPSMVMMVFTSIYGVVDGFFVSNFVGKTPFAAINLVMPFVMVLGGFGFMIGTGGSALVSMTLGMGERERANRYFSLLIAFTVVLGIGLSVLGIVMMRPISIWLGATEAMLEDCVVYGRTVLIFNTAYMLQNVFQTFLTTAEKPRLGLLATVAAAALATGISQVVGGVLPLLYFARPNGSLLRLVRPEFEGGVLLKTCINGSSELMTNISGSLVSIVYNFQLLRFAGEDGVAAYGVLMYVQFIFIAIFFGYTIGAGPIVGYHYGAGNHGEMKNLLIKSMTFTLSAGAAMMVLAQLLAEPLARMFVGYDAGLLEMTTHAFRLFAFSFLLAGVNIFASAFFTALNNGVVSAAISFLRTLVFQLLSVLLLPVFFGLDGIWWAITVAEVCACLISLGFLAAKRKAYHYL